MNMGCGTYLFLMTWGMGIMCTIGSFIVQPRSQAPGFLAIGIACLCAAGIWTYFMVTAPKRAAEEARQKKLAEQKNLERDQKQLAQTEGLEKYHKIDVDDARKYQEGVAAMRQLGMIMQQSVYQEKEKDWAVLGGIAEGIAGPAAGIATALDTMQDNARIKAENAARREWGAKQNAFYQNLASEAARKSPTALSMTELQRKYEAVMSGHPATLLNLIKIDSTSTEIDSQTGAVTVSAKWSQKDKSVCIDGTLRAKLYTSTGKCAGCAYLVLPKAGTSEFKGSLSGICATPIASSQYSIKIEPVNLWELASKQNLTSRKTDGLTLDEHRKVVSDYEKKYQSEVTASL